MSDTDLIAIAALLIAGLSALYARSAKNAAIRANEIATRESRRPLRLQVWHSMRDFSDYCGKYWTLYHMGDVKRARDLVSRIETFKWEFQKHGQLDMPDVEVKGEEFISKAWQMQRLIDRIAGNQNESIDRNYASAEENVEALVDWFGQEKNELKKLFVQYLSAK